MKSNKEQYVCGFLFDKKSEHLVLLKRNKPPEQKGLYNGVGGKVEPGESPTQAMQREFEEEAGLQITQWIPFAEVEGSTWISYFFYARDDDAHNARQMEAQEVECFPMDKVFNLPLMPNLPWLIRLCLDTSTEYAVVKVRG